MAKQALRPVSPTQRRVVYCWLLLPPSNRLLEVARTRIGRVYQEDSCVNLLRIFAITINLNYALLRQIEVAILA